MAIQAPKGTKDMLPQDAYKWHYLEEKIRKITSTYGCREIRTPIFEHTELFTRGVGETTDVVQKEMYTFEDKGGRSITLKPEGTSPAVRAFVESSLYNEAQPTKLYYITPVFRYENVQKGRLRQHHQFGIEVFGSANALTDAEVIRIAISLYKELGVEGIELNINNMGCPECRKKYNDALKEYLMKSHDELCSTCKTRFDRNPLRILDCKEKKCKEIVAQAPIILDYVCDDCAAHFEKLKTYLSAMNIAYKIDPHIVRGLDYYSKTVFELISNGITICGGGRYDYLIEECGGPSMPAVGFGMGMERLLLTLEEKGIEIPKPLSMELFIGSMGEEAKVEAVRLVNSLREMGLKAECDHMEKSVKAQMKYANKMMAAFTVILGEEELQTRTAKLKRMHDGEVFAVELDNLQQIIEIIQNKASSKNN